MSISETAKAVKKVKAGRPFTKESAAKIIFGICAAFSIIAVFAIVVFMFVRSLPAFENVGFWDFLTGIKWTARREDDVLEGKWHADGSGPWLYSEIFGVAPMIVTSFLVTGGAAVIGGVMGVCAAVFIAFYCPVNLEKVPFLRKIPGLKKFPLKGAFGQVINLLASIPSIIVGFFGLEVIVPLAKKLSGDAQNGLGCLSAIIVLSIMITPTIASLTKNSLEAVSRESFEGSLGLGNTKDQTVFRVMLPAAKSGILSAIILGIGRAVGEATAVFFVIGGTPGNFPSSLFLPAASLTTLIMTEMGYSASGSVHQSALIATGFILLVIVLIINFILNFVKKDRQSGNKLFGGKIGSRPDSGEKIYAYRQCGVSQKILKIVSVVISLFIAAILIYMVGFVFVRGVKHISWNFLFGETTSSTPTLRGAFVSTGMMIFMTLLIALPLGIGAAIFLHEYSRRGSKLVKIIRLFVDTLSGVPSIVFGLFGAIFFREICGLGYSLWSGSLTMAIIVLPTIIRSTEESLIEVPDSMREGSLALGASKVRTVFRVVLPSALRGIVTAIILSVGRIVGESAALIYTSGSFKGTPASYGDAGSTFAVLMYAFQVEGEYMNEMYATAAVLIVIVILLDVLVTLAQKKFALKASGDSGKGKKSTPAYGGRDEIADTDKRTGQGRDETLVTAGTATVAGGTER